MMLWIKIELIDNYSSNFHSLKQSENANIANFVYLRENSIITNNDTGESAWLSTTTFFGVSSQEKKNLCIFKGTITK